MDNLDVENKKLTEENERLKKQNAQLLIRIEKLEAEVCSSFYFSRIFSQQFSLE